MWVPPNAHGSAARDLVLSNSGSAIGPTGQASRLSCSVYVVFFFLTLARYTGQAPRSILIESSALNVYLNVLFFINLQSRLLSMMHTNPKKAMHA